MADRKKPAKKPAKGKAKKVKAKPASAPKRRSRAKKKAGAKKVIEQAPAPPPLEVVLAAVEASTSGKLSAAEKVRRDSEIFRGFLRGLTPETLAMTYELSPATVRGIVAEWKAQVHPATTMEAVEMIEEHVMKLDSLVDELAAHGASLKGGDRTRAIMGRLEAMTRRIQFLQSVRILPQDLGSIGIYLDLKSMAESLYAALEKRGLAEPTLMNELSGIIEGGGSIDLPDSEVEEEDEDLDSLPESERAALEETVVG